MSGYAKRMMEAARPWMEANPEPFAERIKVPRTHHAAVTGQPAVDGGWRTRMGDVPSVDGALMGWLQSERRALLDGAHRRLEADSLRLGASVAASRRELSSLLDDFETRINTAGARQRLSSSSHALEDERLLDLALGTWLLSWGHDGYNVFDLSADFVAAILLTDPGTLALDQLRLPFRGLLVLLPDGFARDSVGGSFTKLHLCEVGTQAHGTVIDLVASSGRRLLSTSAPADAVTIQGLDAFGDESKWGVEDDRDRIVIRTLQRIALGLAAYTASVAGAAVRRDGGVKRHGPAKTAPVYWDVARTVRIDPHLVRAARAGSREVALRLKHRHIVRGHYRNQPIGEGRKERKTIWIAPFWKGPADGAAIVHTYKPVAPAEQ